MMAGLKRKRKIDQIGTQLINFSLAAEVFPGHVMFGLRPHDNPYFIDLQNLDFHGQEHLQYREFWSEGGRALRSQMMQSKI